MSWNPNRFLAMPAKRTARLPLAFLLTAWYTTAAFLLVAFATGVLYLGIAENLRQLSEQMLLDELDVCRALVLARSGDSHALREEVEIDSAVRRFHKFYIRVLNDRGQALFTTPGMNTDLSFTQVARAAAEHPGKIFWLKSAHNVPYRAIVSSVPRGPAGQDVWNLQVAVDLTQESEVLGRQRVWTWSVLALGVLLCPWVGAAIARRGTRPLRDVAATARQVSSTNLNERLSIEGYPSELAALAATFNAMLERLEESFTRLSRFSGDIAHELRTPVNNIRGQAEVALARTRSPEEYREVLSSCLEETVRLSELIESLLFLARSESPGAHLKLSDESISGILADLRDYFDATAAEMGVTIRVDSQGLIAEVDRTLLQRALINLVSNALAHTGAGQTIWLTAKAEGERIHIQVRDTGVGIPSAALPHLFDRFYRADPSRTRNSGGSGLGLAIVQQIVFLHRGDIQISSEVGQGTTITLTLPLSSRTILIPEQVSSA